jgi:hypothetical protein
MRIMSFQWYIIGTLSSGDGDGGWRGMYIGLGSVVRGTEGYHDQISSLVANVRGSGNPTQTHGRKISFSFPGVSKSRAVRAIACAHQ